jgi:DNA-binding response OmpR family regulator
MSGRQPTVLLVEDDTGTTEFLAELLEPAGYTVERAHDGVDALERIAAGGIDLVLLDLMLPDLDGLEVCRRVRAQEHDDSRLSCSRRWAAIVSGTRGLRPAPTTT